MDQRIIGMLKDLTEILDDTYSDLEIFKDLLARKCDELEKAQSQIATLAAERDALQTTVSALSGALEDCK